MGNNFPPLPDSRLCDFSQLVSFITLLWRTLRSRWRCRLATSSFFVCITENCVQSDMYRGWLENKRLVPSASTALPLSPFFSFLEDGRCPAQYEIVHAFLTSPTRCYLKILLEMTIFCIQYEKYSLAYPSDIYYVGRLVQCFERQSNVSRNQWQRYKGYL